MREFLWLILTLADFSYLDAVIVKKEDFEWIRTGQKNIEEKAKVSAWLLMRVVFRKTKTTDLPLIKKFTVETGWKDIPERQRRSLNQEKWSRHMEEVFENFARRENSKILIAEDENHVFLGYLFVGEGTDSMTGTTHGFIYDIFVTEAHRDKGIGKTLMKKAESYCREKKYPRILLMVSAENLPAIHLYAKMGFKTEHMYMGKELR